MTEALYNLLTEQNQATKDRGFSFRLNDYNKKLDIYLIDRKNTPDRTDSNRISKERLEKIAQEEFAKVKIKCDCRQYADNDLKIDFIPISSNDEAQKYSEHYLRLSEKLSQLQITLQTGDKTSRSLSKKHRAHYHSLITKIIETYITEGQARAEEKSSDKK